jgi:hypothetical protein
MVSIGSIAALLVGTARRLVLPQGTAAVHATSALSVPRAASLHVTDRVRVVTTAQGTANDHVRPVSTAAVSERSQRLHVSCVRRAGTARLQRRSPSLTVFCVQPAKAVTLAQLSAGPACSLSMPATRGQ